MSDNVNRCHLIISCKINRYIFSLTLFNLGHKYHVLSQAEWSIMTRSKGHSLKI